MPFRETLSLAAGSGNRVSGMSHLRHKLCIHGLAVEIACHVPQIRLQINHLAGPFSVSDVPEGFATCGEIRPYVENEVVRHLSASAARMPLDDPWLEVYQDGERFWLVDERWGIAEINFLRGQWRSWVLERARAHPIQQVEGAVLWPMAQLLRTRGLHLVPAVAVARDGFGALVLSSFGIGRELERVIRGGYRIIGQRWTAMRSDGSRIELLHVPGAVELSEPPRLRRPDAMAGGQWADLSRRFPGCVQLHAFCDVVIVAEPGRRSDPQIYELTIPEAQDLLRQSWPLIDIHPTRKGGQFPTQLGRNCRCVQVQFSKDSGDLLLLLEALRAAAPIRPRLSVSMMKGKTAGANSAA